MAETVYRQMISSFIRQTRPHFRSGKIRGCRLRQASTAAALRGTDDELPHAWQPHSLPAHDSHTPRPRLDRLRKDLEARPFSSFLTDNFAREHNYLRISVTERCNLRCLYCMPEEGIQLSPPDHLLTTPEIVYLSSVFVDQGVNKIRLTGGEPTVRKDIVSLMQQIGRLRSSGLKELCITTNGISLHRKLDAMQQSGLTAVNLSLDTLDPYQFTLMTRRNGHEAVMKSVNRILEMNKLGAGIKLKINCVVMRGINEREIIPFVEMGKEEDLEVRFIEYMPFDGNKWSEQKMMSFQEMLATIREKYPAVGKVEGHPNDTSKTYKVPGFVGRIGFITSMTDNFCGTCNRLRITSDGNLKVCLFGNTEVSLRDILRESNNGLPIDQEAMEAIQQVEMDRRQGIPRSTRSLGVSPREAKLLDIIGTAVKRKKEKHAGMGELEHMENRPMILIDSSIRRTTPASQYCRNQIPFTSSLYVCSRHVPYDVLPSQSPNTIGLRPFSTRATKSSVDRHSSIDTTTTTSSSSSSSSSSPTSTSSPSPTTNVPTPSTLTHLNPQGEAHMISITHKQPSIRSATATTTLVFSSPQTHVSLTTATLAKGDALAVARIAGIQAAKLTATLIPLAHPGLQITGVDIGIEVVAPADPRPSSSFSSSSPPPPPAPPPPQPISTSVSEVEVKPDSGEAGKYGYEAGAARITATVSCEGKTGVEMEALTAANVAGLALYDMLKGVDKGMELREGRVVRKSGGKSGGWRWNEGLGRVVKDGEEA